MKTNKSYKLVLHKKGFGGSGKQEHLIYVSLIDYAVSVRLFLELTFPLNR